MTNMGRILKILLDDNCYVQDIAENPEEADKVFSITRKLKSLPFNIDFTKLLEMGFIPESLGTFENRDELIIKFTTNKE